MFDSFESFYRSDLQGFYLLCVVPLAFLLWRAVSGPETRAGVEPAAAGFVRTYAILFALETMLDPLATGPLLRWLDAEAHASRVMLPFVLLGDFRVFLLVFFVAEPGRGIANAIRRAAGWTLVVPLVAGSTHAMLERAAGEIPGQTLWILYEVAFLALAAWLRASWVPRRVVPERPAVRAWFRAIVGFVMLYYALWATADVLILLGGLDAGWGLRVVPNQLYYGFWIPLVYASFFRGSTSIDRKASASTSVQAAR